MRGKKETDKTNKKRFLERDTEIWLINEIVSKIIFSSEQSHIFPKILHFIQNSTPFPLEFPSSIEPWPCPQCYGFEHCNMPRFLKTAKDQASAIDKPNFLFWSIGQSSLGSTGIIPASFERNHIQLDYDFISFSAISFIFFLLSGLSAFVWVIFKVLANALEAVEFYLLDFLESFLSLESPTERNFVGLFERSSHRGQFWILLALASMLA